MLLGYFWDTFGILLGTFGLNMTSTCYSKKFAEMAEMARMAGNGQKWLDMAGNGWKVLGMAGMADMAGNVWKCLEMTGNG